MSKFNRSVLFLCVVTFSSIVISCKQKPDQSVKETVFPEAKLNLTGIDSVFNQHVQNNDIPGGVALIIKGGSVVYRESFGFRDKEAQKPMTGDAIFRLTFMSVPITYTAMMILYEEGRFSLDDPVSKYIPEFANPKVITMSSEVDENGMPKSYTTLPAKSEITIRHLLTQTSGLTYSFYNQPFIADLYRQNSISNGLVQTQGAVGDVVKKLAALPLLFNPGESWHFGMNADVAGHLVEILSGQSLETFISQHICQPLGMKDTYFYVPDDKLDRVASLYQPSEGGQLIKYPPSTQDVNGLEFTPAYDRNGPYTYFSGGAGLYSTAYDYIRFLQMLLNQGELEGTRILKSETVQLMTSNQLGEMEFFAPGLAYGFGFYVQTNPIEVAKASSVGSYSWGGLFNTAFLVDPPMEMTYVVMCQHFPIGNFEVRDRVDRIIYESLLP